MKGDAQYADLQPNFGINTFTTFIDTADTTLYAALLPNTGSKDSTVISNKSFKEKTVSGIASFYSKSLEGTKTATGETFHHANFTAASNHFPLNSLVRVTNVRNKKSVVVRINDRMHQRMSKKGRVVDLTSAAAKKIGLTSLLGIARVKVESVDENATELAAQ